jgi:hypothetical protein
MFEDLISSLKKRAPARKQGGGFFSGPLDAIEYGTAINVNKLKAALNLQNTKGGNFQFEVAGINGDYVFAIDREYLYCRSGFTYAMLPPTDNVHQFEASRTTSSLGFGMKTDWEIYAIPLRQIRRGIKLTRSGVAETGMGGMRFDYSRLSLTLVDGETVEFNVNSFTDMHFNFLDVLFQEIQETLVKDELLEQAKRHEKLLEFDQAADIYKKYGMDDNVIRLREKTKVKQTIIHGDYVDDRDTTYIDDRDTVVKDSVISKSNIGGSSKIQEIRELKELHDTGAIDDDEFKQMKKEILGK